MNTKHIVLSGAAVAALYLWLTRTTRGRNVAHSVREWLGLDACCADCAQGSPCGTSAGTTPPPAPAVPPAPIEGDATIPTEVELVEAGLGASVDEIAGGLDVASGSSSAPSSGASVPSAQPLPPPPPSSPLPPPSPSSGGCLTPGDCEAKPTSSAGTPLPSSPSVDFGAVVGQLGTTYEKPTTSLILSSSRAASLGGTGGVLR
jgi:hypothetical protein